MSAGPGCLRSEGSRNELDQPQAQRRACSRSLQGRSVSHPSRRRRRLLRSPGRGRVGAPPSRTSGSPTRCSRSAACRVLLRELLEAPQRERARWRRGTRARRCAMPHARRRPCPPRVQGRASAAVSHNGPGRRAREGQGTSGPTTPSSATRPSHWLAFVLRLNFLGSTKRSGLWHDHPPDAVYTLEPRPSFTGGGNDSTEYALIVWRHARRTGQLVDWIRWGRDE